MQNREVPLGSLPIFFSSLRLAEAGRTCPEVRGGETGRGTRATVRGTQKTGARARGAGAAGAGAGAGRGCGTRKTRAWGAGRKTRNTWTRTRTRARATGNGGTGCRTQDAERRTQNAEHGLLAAGSRTRETGARSAEDGRRGHGVQDAGRRTQNTGYWPRAAEHGKRGHGAQETGHRRRGTSPRAWNATRPHTPARPRNNLPGPFTAGRLPPRAAATCRAYESESRRCRRARRTCCCRAAPRPT